jgi:glyoxylase-like metal-dependent hydrolase (beta-lactamase superfamily II)/ferredoxin
MKPFPTIAPESWVKGMAKQERRRAENVGGNFYVDDTCIDCDACRGLAPKVFAAIGGQSAVYSQPQTPEQHHSALIALTACPTASIGTERPDGELGHVRSEFPIPVDSEGEVLYCGYHSQKSFGAASYFLPRNLLDKQANILVDCPREAAPLMRRLQEMGGVSGMMLTHGDDVADHAIYHERFGCERWIHKGDGEALRSAEHVFQGTEPIALDDELLIIPVPGHTRGSCCLLYRNKYLFTGDHLAYSPRRGHLYAFQDACWYSWEKQIQSMERLLDYSFEWVLPGHGRRLYLPADEMRKSLEQCLTWMKSR